MSSFCHSTMAPLPDFDKLRVAAAASAKQTSESASISRYWCVLVKWNCIDANRWVRAFPAHRNQCRQQITTANGEYLVGADDELTWSVASGTQQLETNANTGSACQLSRCVEGSQTESQRRAGTYVISIPSVLGCPQRASGVETTWKRLFRA